MTRPYIRARHLFAPLTGALLLAACGGETETAMEADATDVGGGDLIVTQDTPGAVDVDVPDTPMTNVPPPMTEPAPETSLPAEGPGTTPATRGTTPAM